MKKMLIGIGIIIAFLFIPTDLINFSTEELSINKVAYDESFPSIAHGYTISQKFVPQYNHVKSLKVYVREIQCDISQGWLQCSILDSGENIICQEKLSLAEVISPGWYTIFEEVELTKGEMYYLNINTVGSLDDGPSLSFYTTLNAASKEEEGQKLFYAGFPIENCTLKVSFEYLKPLHRFEYLAYYFFAIFLLFFFSKKYIIKAENKEGGL